MVNFTIDQLRQLMNSPESIRNISVIAHVDHGKTTLTTSLISRAGITAQENTDFMDHQELAKEKGITIKSTGVSLYHKIEDPQGFKEYVINLIDSPGHVDFSSEVTAALRVTDGALVVVDTVEGTGVQTATVLRQAMAEKIKPVLMVNKVDRAILELQLSGEEIYQSFVRTIDNVNVIVLNYEQPDMGDNTLDPTKGNVAFGSGKDGWGFTLRNFARMYSKKFGIDEERLVQKLWGDVYFDQENKLWLTDSTTESGKTLKRSFVQFIMDPICKLVTTLLNGTSEQVEKVLKTIEVALTSEEKQLTGKHLLRAVLPKWINAADNIMEMVVTLIPSPRDAQKYRSGILYTGPQDDEYAQAIRDCNPNGPLMLFVSKMIPTSDKGRFIAFGRVFSGTVSSGQKVRIMGPEYVVSKQQDLYIKNIQKTAIMMGKNVEFVNEVPCGNTVGLFGVDKYILKSGTISDSEGAYPLRAMKFSVSPVVRVAIKPQYPQDLPKLIEGLERLGKFDSLVQVTKEESGEFTIAGSGDLHLEVCLRTLQESYANCPIIKSDPIVSYKESISAAFTEPCLSKSVNKLNRLYCTAEPLSDELSNMIEKGEIEPSQDIKARAKILNENFDWDKEEAQRIWTFGPENCGANILVDTTKGVQYMNEIRDSLESAFQWATKESVLCGESLRSVRFNITDAVIHSDPVHRGGGQMIEAARRVYFASTLKGSPILQEPIFMAEITVPIDASGGVYQCLNQRRAMVVEEEQMVGTPMNIIKAYLPVAESFGFTEHLRSVTSGKAFPQCIFHHWGEFSGDPLEEGSKANDIVKSIRKRKGMKEELPTLSKYLDKL